MINKDLRPTSSARLQSVLQAIAGKIGRLSPGMQRWLKICALMLAALLLAFTVSVPLDLYSQCVFGIGCFVVALMLRRHTGRFQVLLLIALSLTISLRYMFWRVSSTLAFENWGDVIFGYALLAAEIYSLVVLCLGYLQTAWPLQRKPQLMTGPPSEWPTVDIFIPTYNESLDIVSLTILASQAIDWPKDKLRVHVLDDGRREEFRQFCDSAGVNYLTRDNNRHAKAGNLNEALKLTDGEFVAIFDADHVPTRSFLQICLGWFRKDVNLAMLQTPHFFFSPDPFEKNLNTFRSVPNEGELFYGLVQDGNDLWNATFFCGSCAVMRRSALMEIGGIAVETLTEDAHTALKMSRAGYNTAYLAIPQAAGLATESLARHIRQRVRWARGMAQIFRIDIRAAPMLPQRHAALLLWLATSDFPDRAAHFPVFRRAHLSCVGVDDLRLCVASCVASQPDEFHDPETISPFLLERGLRDGTGLVHHVAGVAGHGESQTGRIQCYREGGRD